MRVAARIEASDTGIEFAVVVSDEDDEPLTLADLEAWCATAVRSCHDLRERAITADNDREKCAQLEETT